MCTLIAFHRCVSGVPLVLAANRDEFFERPAEGLALRDTASGIILAPRDRRSGGTWLGLNASGLCAAVTNLSAESPEPARRSRGLLVIDALRATCASQAAKRIEDLPNDAYNPFNLLLADRESAHVVTYLGTPRRIDLAPGAHVIGNVRFGEETAKTKRQRVLVEMLAGASHERLLDELAALCRDHADGDDDRSVATCVHAGAFGTRSSTLLCLGEAPAGDSLRHLDGAPCDSEYRDFTPLLRQLDHGSRSAAGGMTVRNSS
jgi:uncharacterized protein with NRDE domain